ncbi:MAG: PAS domain S-box protein [Leptospiraceae bacterium]|nr:PAS domain S-box protein [Leptospiraceae bacterium]
MNKDNFLKNSPLGYALHKTILNENGNPIDYEFIEVNETFERIIGQEEVKLLGKTARAVIPDIEKSEVDWIDVYGKVALSGSSATFKKYYESLDKYYNVQVYSPERLYFITVFTDITETVSQKTKLYQIINNAKVGTWEWNIETGETVFNEQWAKIIGYTLEELAPISIDTWSKFAHPEDLEKSNAILNAHFEGECDLYECEVRMRHKNGDWVWVQDSGKITEWTDRGKPLIISGIHRDITKRKISELELNQKYEIEKLLSEISSEFIHTKNIDTSIKNSFGKLASQIHASRIYFFMLNSDEETMSNTHEWCAEGVTPEIDNLQDLPLSIFPWWMKKLRNDEIINIPDVSLMPPEALAEQEILESQDIKSLLVLPVYIENRLYGFIGFDNIVSSGNWTGKDTQLLRLLSDILSNAIVRKLNEEELKKSYNNLRNYFDLNTDFVFILNEKGEIIAINKQVREKLGYSEEDLLGKSVLLLHPEEVREEAGQIVEDMINDRRGSCPLPIMAKDGTRILVETMVKKGFWNEKPAMFGISKDISEIKLSEEKFSKIFHNSPEMTGLSNLTTGEYIEVNKAFYTKLGYTPEEVIGKQAYSLVKLDKNFRDRIISELKEKGSVKNIETIMHAKDGKELNVLLSASIIQILDRTYNLTIASDITESVKTKQELIQAKEKAEESDRLKSAFLATMNHELRTPLNHILGFSALLPDMTDDESIIEFSGMIHDSGSNLLNIIEDIFDLAIVEQSEIKIRENEVYIRDIYTELKKQLQEVLSESGKGEDIHLNYKIDSSIVTMQIITDTPKVMQVVSNIIKNAVKYTHKGEISLSLVLEEDHHLSIKVKDTGIGIPEDKLKVIFEFFRQVDDSHTRKYGGVGIGLAISQRIANVIGGTIKVESELGIGSEFTLSFPITIHDTNILNSPKENSSFAVPDLSGKKILIVEDDPIGIGMIANILKPTNCQIRNAVNGQDAVDILKERPDLDLILMDLKMPVMDGFETTQAIRKMLLDLPIIALTAYSLQKDKLKALDVGCNDIITKPIKKEIMFKKLQDFLIK